MPSQSLWEKGSRLNYRESQVGVASEKSKFMFLLLVLSTTTMLSTQGVVSKDVILLAVIA
jgi:hypothetical protein